MKLKQILILSGILVILIAGILFNRSHRRVGFSGADSVPLHFSFQEDQISKVIIYKAKPGVQNTLPQVELIKQKGVWTIPRLWSVRADQNKIERFFKEIKKAKGELRGSSKDLLNDFGIGDNQGFQISLQDTAGKEVLSFLIGTKKADYGTLFVRRKDSDEVYVTEANLYGQMGIFGNPEADSAPLDYWPLKNFAFFDQGNVWKIEIKKYQNGTEKNTLSLANDGGWKFLSGNIPFKPAPEKVSSYLSGMRENAAQTVVDPDAKDYGFSKPRLRVLLNVDSGNPYELTVGDANTKDESVFYVKASGEPAVYLVSKYYLENLGVEESWFFGDNLLEVENGKIEKLTLHAGKQEMSFEPSVKSWDALNGYLENLKNFRIQKPVNAKPRFGKFWIEIKKKGEAQPVILDVAESPVNVEKQNFYPVQKRGSSYTFSISDTFFSQLFENLSRLNEPGKS